ncbi:hypothetical protein LguiB_027590 [Lonicera macranthoides]
MESGNKAKMNAYDVKEMDFEHQVWGLKKLYITIISFKLKQVLRFVSKCTIDQIIVLDITD